MSIIDQIKLGKGNTAISAIESELKKKTLDIVSEERKRVAAFAFDEASPAMSHATGQAKQPQAPKRSLTPAEIKAKKNAYFNSDVRMPWPKDHERPQSRSAISGFSEDEVNEAGVFDQLASHGYKALGKDGNGIRQFQHQNGSKVLIGPSKDGVSSWTLEGPKGHHSGLGYSSLKKQFSEEEILFKKTCRKGNVK